MKRELVSGTWHGDCSNVNVIYSDIGNSNIFNLISEWDTRGHLNDNLNSDAFSVLLGTSSLLLKPIEIHVLKVSSIEGVEAVYAARKENIG